MQSKSVGFFLLSLIVSGAVNAAPLTVRGKVEGFLVQPNASSPTLPQAFVMLNPGVPDCLWNLPPVPAPESNLGRAMVSTVLSAQAAGMQLDITYDAANSCIISQIVSVAH